MLLLLLRRRAWPHHTRSGSCWGRDQCGAKQQGARGSVVARTLVPRCRLVQLIVASCAIYTGSSAPHGRQHAQVALAHGHGGARLRQQHTLHEEGKSAEHLGALLQCRVHRSHCQRQLQLAAAAGCIRACCLLQQQRCSDGSFHVGHVALQPSAGEALGQHAGLHRLALHTTKQRAGLQRTQLVGI